MTPATPLDDPGLRLARTLAGPRSSLRVDQRAGTTNPRRGARLFDLLFIVAVVGLPLVAGIGASLLVGAVVGR